MSKIIAIIPARYDSSRLPGKVLEKIGDKTMLNLVWDQVKKTEMVEEVIIATDDERIMGEAEYFGGQSEMTFSSHRSGTDRCAQVASQFWESDIIINIQADEPFIDPEIIDMLGKKMIEDDWIEIATLCTRIKDRNEVSDPNTVKIVKDNFNKALYFSRAPIPYFRDSVGSIENQYRHIGIYAFRNKSLQSITKLSESFLEKAEKLEQLRWMENGYKIHVFETEYKGTGIDTPVDLEKARQNQ
ncbi:MAG: 3-deoxy-manno-octulosonate cytidylyltransferase [Saprospiraceae bacterium]|nr:3-deoxy-manno-octulosonate cytidylyltransferase [Saprospiraceae bacterium]